MQSLKGACLGLAGMEESHAHLLWLVAVMGLHWGHIIGHPELLSSWFTWLVLAAGWKPNKSSGKI